MHNGIALNFLWPPLNEGKSGAQNETPESRKPGAMAPHGLGPLVWRQKHTIQPSRPGKRHQPSAVAESGGVSSRFKSAPKPPFCFDEPAYTSHTAGRPLARSTVRIPTDLRHSWEDNPASVALMLWHPP